MDCNSVGSKQLVVGAGTATARVSKRDFPKLITEAKQAEVEARQALETAETWQDQMQEAIKGISEVYHPYDLTNAQAMPELRMVALLVGTTHVMLDLAFAACRGKGTHRAVADDADSRSFIEGSASHLFGWSCRKPATPTRLSGSPYGDLH